MKPRKIFLIVIFIVGLMSSTNYCQDKIQAKIGVLQKKNDQFVRLKSKDRMKVGDEFRIYVSPLNALFVYVVYSDQKTAMLLSDPKTNHVEKNSLLSLPSEQEFYQVDDKTSKCKISIILSKNKLSTIDKLFASKDEIEISMWNAEEKKYDEGEIDLNDRSDKPFVIAGNVRGGEAEIINRLQLISGKTILSRKYEIEIKK